MTETPTGDPAHRREIDWPSPRAASRPTESLATPIWPSTTYELRDLDASARMASTPRSTEFYARNGTPTVQAFADAVAAVEGAEAGLAFGSGMGAVASVVLGMCSSGDRIVAQASMFSVTTQLLARTCPRFGIDVDFVDAFDAARARRRRRGQADAAGVGRDAGQPDDGHRRPRGHRARSRARSRRSTRRWPRRRCRTPTTTGSTSWSTRRPRASPATTTRCSAWSPASAS